MTADTAETVERLRMALGIARAWIADDLESVIASSTHVGEDGEPDMATPDPLSAHFVGEIEDVLAAIDTALTPDIAPDA